MSDDSDDNSGGGSDSGGFFSAFWNAFLSLFGSNDGQDDGTHTTEPDAGQQQGTPGSGQPTTTPTTTPETTADAAPDSVTTTAPPAKDDPNPLLPPNFEAGRWYQNIDGRWVLTNFTDVRDLGNGEFQMVDDDGVTNIHYSGGGPPDDPRMTGFVDVHQQGPADVSDGTPNPNTWVYTYASQKDLPSFLQQPPNWDGNGWLVPSTDGGPMYVVTLNPDGTVTVWRVGK